MVADGGNGGQVTKVSQAVKDPFFVSWLRMTMDRRCDNVTSIYIDWAWRRNFSFSHWFCSAGNLVKLLLHEMRRKPQDDNNDQLRTDKSLEDFFLNNLIKSVLV